MLDNALNVRNISTGKKITYKTLVSVGFVVLAVVLPQIVHLALKQSGGVQWLPMYLPVLMGGCLLGAKWSVTVGVLSPVVSFLVTSAMGHPMPMAERLPFMMAELAVFALVSGLFSNKIYKNSLWVFVAVILAQVCGRGVFLGLVAIFQSTTSLEVGAVWQQIQLGLSGMVLQIVVVPVFVIVMKKLLK